MWRGLVAVIVFAQIARADELDTVRTTAPTCDPSRAHCFGIQLHVVASDHGLVATPDWIAAQLAAANRHFERLDVGFQLAGIDTLPATAIHVQTRGDRDALADDRLGGKVIHVFVIGQLDDVDEAGQIAYGVTWHQRHDDRKYIIVSAMALERTLAHEIGHFFGLPHSSYAVSIMNKTARADPPMDQRTFADEEITAMKPALKRLLHDRVIIDLR